MPPSSPSAQWYHRNKTAIWGSAAAALAAYAAYSYTAGSKGPSQYQKMKATLANYSATLSAMSDTFALVSGDLQTFLTSDAEELPQSLRQLNRLLQAPELQDTLQTAVASMVKGVTSATAGPANPDAPPMLDTIIEAVLSERGRGLVGMAVGIATRNATTACCECMERMAQASGGSSSSFTIKDVLDTLGSEQGERVLSLLITKSIKTAVSTYVDATSGYNMYEDFLSSVSKKEHRDAVTDIMSRITGAFCKEVAAAYRKSKGPSNNSTTTSSQAASLSSQPSSSTPAVTITTSNSSSSFPVTSSSLTTQQEQPSTSIDGAKPHGRPISAIYPKNAIRPLHPPAWLKQVVDLAKERDVRTLAVDVVKNASREATRGAIEGLFSSSEDVREVAAYEGLSAHITSYKLYVMASLAISLFMYALSPHTVVI